MDKILVVIDCQNDFIDGILGTKEAQAIIPNIVKRIKEFDGSYIIYTQDTHYANYDETIEGKNIPIHCIMDTEGWKLNKDVYNALRSVPKLQYGITKDTFAANKLAQNIYTIIPDTREEFNGTIELTGLCTDICVISNALLLRSAFPKARIIVNSKCCAGTSIENHNKALDIMKQCLVEVI